MRNTSIKRNNVEPISNDGLTFGKYGRKRLMNEKAVCGMEQDETIDSRRDGTLKR